MGIILSLGFLDALYRPTDKGSQSKGMVQKIFSCPVKQYRKDFAQLVSLEIPETSLFLFMLTLGSRLKILS